MISKFILCEIFILLLVLRVYSQTVPDSIPRDSLDMQMILEAESEDAEDFEILNPLTVPPSPTAFELGLYGQVPVGMFTGTIQYSIPLYTLKGKNLELPVSLSYSNNGIKIGQPEPWTGNGWTLNAGGVITRIVRDIPDEQGTQVYKEQLMEGYNDIWEQICFDTDNHYIDTEPDLYSFNFNGYTGKYIIGKNNEPLLIPYQDLKIENNGTKITVPDGTVYWFEETERTRTQRDDLDAQEGVVNCITAHFLSKIVHPSGEEINFGYKRNQYQYSSTETNKQTELQYFDFLDDQNEHFCNPPNIDPYLNYSVENKMYVCHIDTISNDNVKLIFHSSKTHPGIDDFKLDSITIHDKSELSPDRKIVMGYTTTNKGRLFLSSVTMDKEKKYIFDYYSPNNVPARTSKAIDHWGYYNGANSNQHLIPLPIQYTNFFSISNPANRNPNPTYAVYGLLKHITWPTGGTTNIEYEGHEYWGIDKESAPKVSFKLETNGEGNTGKKTVVKTLTLPTEQYININYIFKCENGSDRDGEGEVKISKVSGGAPIQEDFYFDGTCPPNSMQQKDRFLLFSAGDYTIEVSTVCEDYITSVDFKYINKTDSELYTNLKTGGMRVKRTVSKESEDDTSPEITRYYYTEGNGHSSAAAPRVPKYFTKSYIYKECDNSDFISESPSECPCQPGLNPAVCKCEDIYTFYNLTSSPANEIYNEDGYHIAYSLVKKSNGENFEDGGEIFNYKAISNSDAEMLHSSLGTDWMPGASSSNTGRYSGTLKYKQVIGRDKNGELKTFQDEIYSYNSEGNDTTVFVPVVMKQYFRPRCPDFGYRLDPYDIAQYRIMSGWHKLIQKKNIVYDENGQNPVTDVTDYYYDNLDKHGQLSRIETKDSKGDQLTTQIFYPQDYTSTVNNLDDLKSKYIISNPIDIRKTANGKLTSGRLIKYNENGQPVEIIEAENELGSASLPFLEDNPYNYGVPRTVISYHNSCPVQENQVNNIPISFLWGYNKSYIVAMIKNASYVQVENAIGGASVISAIEESSDSTFINQKLRLLRNNLTSAMVSYYSYAPLVGMTSETGPDGKTTYYEYDDFGRLAFVRDQNGNIVKKHEYHYAGQN